MPWVQKELKSEAPSGGIRDKDDDVVTRGAEAPGGVPTDPLPASAASPSAPAQGAGGPDPVPRQGLVQGSPLRALQWAPHQYSLRSASWVRARSERPAAELQRFPLSLWQLFITFTAQSDSFCTAGSALRCANRLNFLTSSLQAWRPSTLSSLPSPPPSRSDNVPQWSRLHPAL